jgi:hypothetical protein
MRYAEYNPIEAEYNPIEYEIGEKTIWRKIRRLTGYFSLKIKVIFTFLTYGY